VRVVFDSLAAGLIVLVVLTALAVYVLPSLIAIRRRHPDLWIIVVINVFLGGTIIGWIVALVLALRYQVHSQTFVPEIIRRRSTPPTAPADWRSAQHRFGLDEPGRKPGMRSS
jgi:hypothetical protein